MPFATSTDILTVVASHLDSVHQLAMLCAVNKTTSAYFLREAGIHWARIGKSVCGEEYWARAQAQHGVTVDDENGRYLTMIFMCPWVSQPVQHTESGDDPHPKHPFTTQERTIIKQLRRQQWAPAKGIPVGYSMGDMHYSPIRRAVKLHDAVLMVVCCTDKHDAQILQGHVYFVSAKDLRLLRDMYEHGGGAWTIKPACICLTKRIYEIDEDDGNATIVGRTTKIFSLRLQDRNVALQENNSSFVSTKFWAACRGDDDAVEELLRLQLHDHHVHEMTLMQHVIQGGSIHAVERLLQADSDLFLTDEALWHALRHNKTDIIRLLHAELEKKKPGFINDWIECSHSWLEHAVQSFTCLDTVLNLILVLGADVHHPTVHGKTLLEIFLKSATHYHFDITPPVARKIQQITALLEGGRG